MASNACVPHELEEIARMESLTTSALTLEHPVIEGPAFSASDNSGPMDRSEIERTLGEK